MNGSAWTAILARSALRLTLRARTSAAGTGSSAGAPVPVRMVEPESVSGFQLENELSSSRGMKREYTEPFAPSLGGGTFLKLEEVIIAAARQLDLSFVGQAADDLQQFFLLVFDFAHTHRAA